MEDLNSYHLSLTCNFIELVKNIFVIILVCRVAYAQLKMHHDAIASYNKALELEPGNETYLNNLRISQEMVEQNTSSAAPNLGQQFQTGGMQFGQLLNNPTLINMASQLMNDPNMSQVYAIKLFDLL